jgi:hypothetical protein
MAMDKEAVGVLLTALTGKNPGDEEYIGKKVYRRGGRGSPGTVTNTSICRLEGCGGTRLHVKWPDGHRTYPCAKGCKDRADGSLQIE